MRVNLLQYNMIWEDRSANRNIIMDHIDAYNEKQNGLEKNSWLILPEMSLSGFSMDCNKTSIDDSDWIFFRDLAISNSVYLTFGCVIEGQNKMITLNPNGTEINSYSKIHLFTYSGEDRYYSPGNYRDNSYKYFKIADFNIMPAICYDLRFSYLFWPVAKQTDIYVLIANWPKSRRENWKALLKARAIENQAYFIGVNRTGTGNNLEYSGDSMVIDPIGNEVLDCKDKEGIFSVDIAKSVIVEAREKLPFIRDRVV